MLIRTQILLDSQTKAELLSLSQTTNQSISQLVRRFVSQQIKEEKKKIKRTKKMSGVEALLAMAKSAKKLGLKGPRDLAQNHDYHLYGAPKK